MSSHQKGSLKQKFISNNIGDLKNKSHCLQKSPKTKRNLKRKISDVETEEDISKLIGLYQTSAKNKADAAVECKETRQKLIRVMGNQLDARFVCTVTVIFVPIGFQLSNFILVRASF